MTDTHRCTLTPKISQDTQFCFAARNRKSAKAPTVSFPHTNTQHHINTTKMTAVYRAAGTQGNTLLSAEASDLSPTCLRYEYEDCNDCDDASAGSSTINNVGCWPRPMTTTDEENRNDSLLRNDSWKDAEAVKDTEHADPDGDHCACITTTSTSAADTGNAGRGRNRGVDQTPDAITGRAIRKTFKGDIGLALFSPLVLAEDPPDISATARSRSDLEVNCGADDEADEEEPVALAKEDAEVLRSSPRLLTPEQMRRIRNEGLHSTAQIMRWHRPYSLSRDGDSFYTMMEKCGRYRHTIVVCRTTAGDLLGGYADTSWKLGGSNTFFGSGRAFLFATRPDLSGEERESRDLKSGIVGRGNKRRREKRPRPISVEYTACSNTAPKRDQAGKDERDAGIYVFPWTGNNTYSQVCNAQLEKLAMGGGGSFGFIVQENFSKGSTGPCSTFNNPRLIRDPSGCFEIVDLEVYGLKSCLFEA